MASATQLYAALLPALAVVLGARAGFYRARARIALHFGEPRADQGGAGGTTPSTLACIGSGPWLAVTSG